MEGAAQTSECSPRTQPRTAATAASATTHRAQQPASTSTTSSALPSSIYTSPFLKFSQQTAASDQSTSAICFVSETRDLPMDNNDTDITNTALLKTSGSSLSSPVRPRANTTSAVNPRKRQADAGETATRPRAQTFSAGCGAAANQVPHPRINLRNRINRHPVKEKVRHKREALQDMARPLKHWLYKNRDNPYPTRPQKQSLARGSKMTLVQVSNWFANARRRLKNTVQEKDISWSRRIKKYNSHVQGNAELLSGSSDDSMWDSSEDTESTSPANTGNQGNNITTKQCDNVIPNEGDEACAQSSALLGGNNLETQQDTGALFCYNHGDAIDTSTRSRNSSGYCSEDQSQPQKYKQTMLHRYLHDACDQVYTQANVESDTTLRMRYRCPSGSVSSHDFDDIASARSTPTREHQYMFEDHQEEVEEFFKQRRNPDCWSEEEESLYYKEISAALALTSLARNKCNKMTSSK